MIKYKVVLLLLLKSEGESIYSFALKFFKRIAVIISSIKIF